MLTRCSRFAPLLACETLEKKVLHPSSIASCRKEYIRSSCFVWHFFDIGTVVRRLTPRLLLLRPWQSLRGCYKDQGGRNIGLHTYFHSKSKRKRKWWPRWCSYCDKPSKSWNTLEIVTHLWNCDKHVKLWHTFESVTYLQSAVPQLAHFCPTFVLSALFLEINLLVLDTWLRPTSSLLQIPPWWQCACCCSSVVTGKPAFLPPS